MHGIDNTLGCHCAIGHEAPRTPHCQPSLIYEHGSVYRDLVTWQLESGPIDAGDLPVLVARRLHHRDRYFTSSLVKTLILTLRYRKLEGPSLTRTRFNPCSNVSSHTHTNMD